MEPRWGGAPATAIVVDGIIAAVAAARPHAAGSLLVSAMIPERSTSAGAHEIALYTVSAASSKRGQTGEIELRLAGKRSVTLPTAAPERSR